MFRVPLVNTTNVAAHAMLYVMDGQGERLTWAREKAGYETAKEAAEAFGWKVSTYSAHENGQNNLRPDVAQRYAKAFKVSFEWLLTGEGLPKRGAMVRKVGYVGAGAQAHYYDSADADYGEEVEMPPGASPRTVAVQVRGESMPGVAEDGWLLYFDDRHEPPATELIGELCIVGLADDRVLVKKLMAGSRRGLFHLFSRNADPILDQKVVWAARVTWIRPR